MCTEFTPSGGLPSAYSVKHTCLTSHVWLTTVISAYEPSEEVIKGSIFIELVRFFFFLVSVSLNYLEGTQVNISEDIPDE